MPPFINLDWSNLDVPALVSSGGLVMVKESRHEACREWLLGHGYGIDTFDCRVGLDLAIPELGRLMRWEEHFGYTLAPGSRPLDSLRDGFYEFDISGGVGRVFEIIRADLGCQESDQWMGCLLADVQEKSNEEFARGRQFFGLLVIPSALESVLPLPPMKKPGPKDTWRPIEHIDQMESTIIPRPFGWPWREIDEFAVNQVRGRTSGYSGRWGP